MILRLLKRLFSAEVLGLLLVIVAFQALTYGISSSLRGTETNYLFWVCLVSGWISWGLSKAKWNGTSVSAGIVGLGVITIWILAARLIIPLIELIHSGLALIPQIVPALRERTVIDTSMVADLWTVVAQTSSILATRWQIWLTGMTNEDTSVNDPLIRNMIWTLMMWLLAAWTGWFTARRNAILALLPHLTLLAVVISYSERKVETLWLMVFTLLLLMGVWNYKNHINWWEQRRVDYSDSIRYDNTQAVLLLAICIGIVSFITPSISWRQIRDFLREHNDVNKTAEMLGIQQQVVRPKIVPAQKASLPREHLLTEGFEQSQQLVMTIRTGELPPIPDVSDNLEVPRYYWRSTVYDGYTGAGWVTTYAPPQNIKANTPLISGLLDGYRPLHIDVNLQQPEGKLFWSGMLYSADIPFRADWRVRPQSDLFGDQTLLLQADIFDAATSASSYSTEAYIPAVTLQKLRNASTDYPEEIRLRYFQLPNTVPDRVHQMAQFIVKGKDNPYDKAKAIETYLRTYYPYDLNVPVPPEDQDVADYFLFDLKKGYCDYYATAMVVLARLSGLPARFVSGYSSGAYDAPQAQYVIRELNAHSWVEIYFPEIGWIEFEPTGSQPEIERPEKEVEIVKPVKPVTPSSRFLFQLTHGTYLYWLSFLGVVLLLIVLYFAFFERMFFMSIAPLTAIEILYRRYYRSGRSLAGQWVRAETAYEFTNKLVRRLEEIRKDPTGRWTIKKLESDVNRLTNIYYSTLFSNHKVEKNEVRTALQIWRSLRMVLFKERLRNFILNKTAPLIHRIKR